MGFHSDFCQFCPSTSALLGAVQHVEQILILINTTIELTQDAVAFINLVRQSYPMVD